MKLSGQNFWIEHRRRAKTYEVWRRVDGRTELVSSFPYTTPKSAAVAEYLAELQCADFIALVE